MRNKGEERGGGLNTAEGKEDSPQEASGCKSKNQSKTPRLAIFKSSFGRILKISVGDRETAGYRRCGLTNIPGLNKTQTCRKDRSGYTV